MIREFNPGTNEFDVFFEQFETITEAGIDLARWKPDGELEFSGYRFLAPPTFIRLPYGALDIGSLCVEHDFARALVEFDGSLWRARVCRVCEYTVAPEPDGPFDFFRLGEPVEHDALPAVQAPRGGIRYLDRP